MPYIEQHRRKALEISFESDEPQTAGELNYLFSDLVNLYLKIHGLNYQTCNDAVGALENAKHEFQRRVQDPYEDLKMQANGDVY